MSWSHPLKLPFLVSLMDFIFGAQEALERATLGEDERIRKRKRNSEAAEERTRRRGDKRTWEEMRQRVREQKIWEGHEEGAEVGNVAGEEVGGKT